MDPDALAEELLCAELAGRGRGDLESVLAGLAELRAGLPEIDGMALVRGSRHELEERCA